MGRDCRGEARESDSRLDGLVDRPRDLRPPELGGGVGVHWLQALVDTHGISTGARWLGLGCGAAGTELAASSWRLFGSMVALDASPASLKIAASEAKRLGVANIEFGSADLEHLALPRESFDVVLMNMSLHHVRDLRSVLSQVSRTLRPTGFFIVHEFVGPRQFQFTDLQLGLVRDLLAVVPERYRRDSTNGEIKSEYVRRSVEYWNVADPSEAIRSDRILPELQKQFRIVEGGTTAGRFSIFFSRTSFTTSTLPTTGTGRSSPFSAASRTPSCGAA